MSRKALQTDSSQIATINLRRKFYETGAFDQKRRGYHDS